MQKKQKLISRLAAMVTILLLLNLFTFVMTASAILQVCDDTPAAGVDIDLSQTVAAAPPPVVTMPAGDEHPEDMVGPGHRVVVNDKDLIWETDTEVEIFHARYHNATGELTVDSRGGDSVIAPGTESRYYFDIRNNGNTGVRYTLTAESASATVEYNGQTVSIPLEVKLSDYRGNYVTGSAGSWAPLEDLDGAVAQGSVRIRSYIRYILDWRWPFEGDDALDTFLGNLAAEDAELTVRIAFNVVAVANDEADEGIPQTGDNSNIALWSGICVLSAFALILLLFRRRKEEDEEKAA